MIIDISLPLNRNLITYPGNAFYEEYAYRTHEKDHVHIMRVLMETHTGTHFDAPYHMLKTGKKANEINLETFIGMASVIEVSGIKITEADIPEVHEKIVLFKTHNSSRYDVFHEDFAYITESAARKLVKHQIKLVGIDYLSVEQFGTSDPTVHKIFMKENIIIVEGLYLQAVTPGTYEFICLPLKMQRDGAPCRAILRTID